MKFIQFAIAAIASEVSSQDSVAYDIKVNGETKTLYATGDSWYGDQPESYKLNVTGADVGIPFGGRMMLA